MSAIEKLQYSGTPQELLENCSATSDTTDLVIGILLMGSSISITQSWFEGNKVGLGGVIHGEFGSDVIPPFLKTVLH